MTDKRSISLPELIHRLPGDNLRPAPALPEILINGIALDSRKVLAGNLFVAVSGGSTDGHRYISNAIQQGAVAVVGTQDLTDLTVPYIRVADSRQTLAELSAAFYDFPARHLTVIGVTGTDGKTTTSNLIHQILRAAGIPAGMISTVNALIGEEVLDTGFHVTTPEAPDVQRYLARMVEVGLTTVVLEVTSHGLEQRRVAACDFDLGVVTNITHEHLDYHGSYEAYRAAKGRLFTSLAETPLKGFNSPHGAVLNRDDESYPYLSSITKVPQVSYGFHPDAAIRAKTVIQNWDGLEFVGFGKDVHGEPFSAEFHSRLVGAYNVSNCLAAIAATVAVMGLDVQDAQRGIAELPGVPGRSERIDLGQDFIAMVDFAHTPNALKRELESTRTLAGAGRLIAVFGSAGLRDREKRRMMAETSVDLADLTVLTAEDPRTESLQAILAEMAAGATARGGVEGINFWRIPNRGDAIRFAVQMAQPGDVVIACGKGHEQSMCFGETEYAWDDRIAMRAALAERLGLPGPEMPALPE